eukprot:TRINITY_DN17499_c0_g1_i1.p1 TRINITY_DN17499_c0_g1~~TRINITY_DN17499_c0_g1_i1.p1  ORF type:complete len:351 (-),score=100.32 TRINITY_DN17499_c0_g1_i1:533-1516(-)
MDDVIYQEEVVSTLRKAIETRALPHLLFYGPPGTGKTSTVMAVARELYGSELMKERVLELNASDERGINVVRTKIKEFAMTSAAERPLPGGRKSPGYKLVVLDEADSMTSDAQNALRRTIEVYSRTTRFCLICNFVSRVIEPLASRCAKFRFKPLCTDAVVTRLEFICEKEGFKYPTEVLMTICRVSGGDLRKAITSLQSLYTSCGNAVTPATVQELAGIVPDEVMRDFFTACKSNSFENLRCAVEQVGAAGYAADQFLSQLLDTVLGMDDLGDTQKARIAEALSAADHALLDGASERLQLLSVGADIMATACAQPAEGAAAVVTVV